MKPVVLSVRALADIQLAGDFYEERAHGLGNYFTEMVLKDIKSLETLHGFHSKHFGLFRLQASRFPFGIYYQLTDSEVRVIAVLDLRSNPPKLRSALKTRR